MKKPFLSGVCALMLSTQFSSAQTNTFPSTGSVGIGTTTPIATLDILGGNTGHGLLIRNNVSGQGIGFVGGYSSYLGYGSNDHLVLGSYEGKNVLLNPVAGNAGVGTDNPVSLFQVDDGCTKASIGDASGGGLNYGTSYLGFNATRVVTSTGGSWLTSSDGTYNGGGMMYSTIYGDLYFANIPTTGGSGQTLSDATVKGNINFRINANGTTYAKKVIVELTGWPDYVFRPNYKLRPLSEVKAYIDQNHRLPEMPSDKEVEKNGVDVAEMNKMLTKKVEELTLYLLEKDKEVKGQREQISKLQRQMNDVLKKLK